IWFGYVGTRAPLTGTCHRCTNILLCVLVSLIPQLDSSSLATWLVRIPPCGFNLCVSYFSRHGSTKRFPRWIVFPGS
ncbi:unnamed protein product, partial [Prunus brigantina]